jgi:hypothetical protein
VCVQPGLIATPTLSHDAVAAFAGDVASVLRERWSALCSLPIASAIGMGEAFWVFAAICALAFAFARRYVPETKALTFSEIGAELRERWGGERGQEVPAY